MARDKIKWTPEAEARLRKVPFFVRKFARARVEAAAAARGEALITEALVDQVKKQEMR